METMNPKEIKTHKSFEALFPIRPELLETIEEGMKLWEYDESQPIVLATWEGQDEPVCIDGHTRLLAAMNAGIMEVPVYTYDYTSEAAAIEHAIELQCHRRNLTDAELFRLMEITDKRCVPERNENGEFAGAPNGAAGKSSEVTAELLGISSRKVERMRTILDHGDAKTVEAVRNDEMSVNKGYEQTQKKRKSTKEKTAPLEDNDGDAASDSPPALPAPNEEETVASEDAESEPVDDITVTLAPKHYRALKDLGGSIEDHVAKAIEKYVQSSGNPDAHEDTCTDLDEEEEEYDDGEEDL
ncbi:MAG: hypothetical protein ACLP5H_16860 [Desulfomonilaceae bacterium]